MHKSTHSFCFEVYNGSGESSAFSPQPMYGRELEGSWGKTSDFSECDVLGGGVVAEFWI